MNIESINDLITSLTYPPYFSQSYVGSDISTGVLLMCIGLSIVAKYST